MVWTEGILPFSLNISLDPSKIASSWVLHTTDQAQNKLSLFILQQNMGGINP